MPRYRVTSGPDHKVWLHFQSPDGPAPRLLKAGQEFSYDGWPNAFMEPLDDEAREIVRLRDELRAAGRPLPETPELALAPVPDAPPPPPPVPHDPGAVGIPADWRESKVPHLAWTKLARQIVGGPFDVPPGMTKTEKARHIIEAEETRRGASAAA